MGTSFTNASGDLGDERFELLLRSYAAKISERGLAIPAIFFLEMHKPLTTLAHTATQVGVTIAQPLFGSCFGAQLLKLLESRENVERLISYLEESEANQ